MFFQHLPEPPVERDVRSPAERLFAAPALGGAAGRRCGGRGSFRQPETDRRLPEPGAGSTEVRGDPRGDRVRRLQLEPVRGDAGKIF